MIVTLISQRPLRLFSHSFRVFREWARALSSLISESTLFWRRLEIMFRSAPIQPARWWFFRELGSVVGQIRWSWCCFGSWEASWPRILPLWKLCFLNRAQMVIIPRTRQVCKAASPEPEPLSAPRARSCKYVSFPINCTCARIWRAYRVSEFIPVLSVRNFSFSSLWRGCGVALGMEGALRYMRSQNGHLSCKTSKSLTCQRTCKKILWCLICISGDVACREVRACRIAV